MTSNMSRILAAILLTSMLCAVCWARRADVSLIPCDPEVSKQCPAQDPPTPVYLADPSDCSKFCECSGGTAYSESCQPQTLWDDGLNICNWASMVDCGDRPIPPM
ncbi:peritrophin-1-like isoform X2 [Palaemon carinicauda]|uniref:peritrophin-1-like isoform X2 n=1 Tax=Palaemon carinicauda TaxID=392227 RepID=UPI0035B5B0D8